MLPSGWLKPMRVETSDSSGLHLYLFGTLFNGKSSRSFRILKHTTYVAFSLRPLKSGDEDDWEFSSGRWLYFGVKLGEHSLQLGLKVEVMYSHWGESRQCHWRVGTDLGILLPAVQSAFARRPRVPAQSTSPSVASCRQQRVLESAATKFISGMCLVAGLGQIA